MICMTVYDPILSWKKALVPQECTGRLNTHGWDTARLSGPDGRILPSNGTNQISRFVEYRPLTHREKNNLTYRPLYRSSRLICRSFCRSSVDWDSVDMSTDRWSICSVGEVSVVSRSGVGDLSVTLSIGQLSLHKWSGNGRWSVTSYSPPILFSRKAHDNAHQT